MKSRLYSWVSTVKVAQQSSILMYQVNVQTSFRCLLNTIDRPLNDYIVDLVVTVDPTLKYYVHINQLVAKARSRVEIIDYYYLGVLLPETLMC